MAAAAREWVIAVPENCREFLHIGQHRSTLIREKSHFTSIGLRKNSLTESEAYQHMVLHPGKWPQLSCELNPAVFLWLRRSWSSADNKFLGSSLQQCLQSFWQNFLEEAYRKGNSMVTIVVHFSSDLHRLPCDCASHVSSSIIISRIAGFQLYTARVNTQFDVRLKSHFGIIAFPHRSSWQSLAVYICCPRHQGEPPVIHELVIGTLLSLMTR